MGKSQIQRKSPSERNAPEKPGEQNEEDTWTGAVSWAKRHLRVQETTHSTMTLFCRKSPTYPWPRFTQLTVAYPVGNYWNPFCGATTPGNSGLDAGGQGGSNCPNLKVGHSVATAYFSPTLWSQLEVWLCSCHPSIHKLLVRISKLLDRVQSLRDTMVRITNA